MYTHTEEDNYIRNLLTEDTPKAFSDTYLMFYDQNREAGLEPEEAFEKVKADVNALPKEEIERLNHSSAYDTDEEAFEHLYEGFGEEWHEVLYENYLEGKRHGLDAEYCVCVVRKKVKKHPLYQLNELLSNLE